jgi:tRNA A-37 threonylcarbamoyl transferase component Bud32
VSADELQRCGQALLVDRALTRWVEETLAPLAATPERLPGAEVVKSNRVRTVVRVPGPDGLLYVKRFRLVRLGDRLLSLFRASAARREWTALERVAGLGIPCPVPVVLAEERRHGLLVASLLATRALEGTDELTRRIDALRARQDQTLRPALLGQLARLVALMFTGGVDHPDLHLANFLVRDDRDLFALDLHSARLRSGGLAPRARRARLAKLAHSFGLFDPDTAAWGAEELVWFARAWAEADRELGPADALVHDLRARAARIEAARVKGRDRRCLVDSTIFVSERGLARRVWRRRELSAEQVAALVEAPAVALVHAHPRGRSRIEVVEHGGLRLIRKRYPFPTLRSRLAGLREPLPLRAWKAARACEVRGVPAPKHVALVLEGALWPTRGTILMELLADVTMVHRLLEAPAPPAPAARQALAKDLGRTLGRMHATGLKHRDLAVQNLLVRPRDDGAGWHVWVVDLDEVRTGALSREEKLRALTQLADLPPAATRTDRLRFFRAYLAAGGAQVLAPELDAWGAIGIGRKVGERLAARMAAKAKRQARRVAKPAPTDLGALGS